MSGVTCAHSRHRPYGSDIAGCSLAGSALSASCQKCTEKVPEALCQAPAVRLPCSDALRNVLQNGVLCLP